MESSRWESFWAEESGGAEAGEGTGADQISIIIISESFRDMVMRVNLGQPLSQI
jgi:hypothetical protein